MLYTKWLTKFGVEGMYRSLFTVSNIRLVSCLFVPGMYKLYYVTPLKYTLSERVKNDAIDRNR